MSENPFRLQIPETDGVPLLISIPHCGTQLAPGQEERLASATVRALPDTDWHLEWLYAFGLELRATVLSARFSRYVVDLNRPPDAKPLYPGRFETGLVPTTTFEGEALYLEGEEPGAEERAARVEAYWRPYHEALASELARLRAAHGAALLFDAHSIRGHVPRLHPDPLPDLMVGTAGGTSCADGIARAFIEELGGGPHDLVRDQIFLGGYITRSYGTPERGVHALQLEMSQRIYMDEDPPFPLVEERARRLQPLLRSSLEAALEALAAQPRA